MKPSMWRPTSILLITALVLIAAAVVWWNWSVFSEIGAGMPAIGWVALIFGVILALGIGGGLMFLVFYSSRHGYDDAVSGANERRTGDPPGGQP